ncbi:ribbon-helix-helix protein, CopG family [Rhodococcus hoagii]|nr:ribbon-helix-helix protein, CopG family [Prescottella equi]
MIRVAIRRLLADQDGLGAVVHLREENRATRPLFDAVVNMHLDMPTRAELDRLAARHGTTRAEIMRIAVDRFLLELAELRLAGTPFDIETAVNEEIFNGTANRERLIARRQRREAARQATS